MKQFLEVYNSGLPPYIIQYQHTQLKSRVKRYHLKPTGITIVVDGLL